MKSINGLLISLLMFVSISAFSTEVILPISSYASGKNLYAATTGEVVLTFLSKSAAYSSDLFLEGTPTKILNNQSTIAGTQFSLGSFQAGTDLIFSLFVNNTGNTFFSGMPSNNPDNIAHSSYEIMPNNSIIVGFEDLFNGGDKDYNDLIFSLSNVGAGTFIPSPVPEPETYAMLIAGFLMLILARRRECFSKICSK